VNALTTTAVSLSLPPPALPALGELRQLAEAAQHGNRPAATRLRELFLWHGEQLVALAGGDLAARVKQALIRRAVPSDEALERAALERKLDRIRDELAGPSPTPIERLLAERVALSWLDVHLADLLLAARWGEELGGTHAANLDRYRDRAHRRYLAALKTLSQVRKLAVPVLQLNLATNQQVNAIHADTFAPACGRTP